MARERMSREELAHRTMLRTIGGLLETNPAFRRFLWTILRDLRIFASVYSRGSNVDTAYLVGRRDAGLEVIHLLKEVRPDILGLLEREGLLLDQDAKPLNPEDTDEDLPNPTDDERDPDLEP